MYRIYLWIATLLISFSSSHAQTQTEIKQDNNNFKTLVLIIANDNKPAYIELQKIWKAYMNSDPEHFDIYFLKADPNLSKDYVIEKNLITIKGSESLVPGITNKTIKALEAFQPQFKNYAFVIRTNLSSFYSLPNLYKYLKVLPKKNCYCGLAMYASPEFQIPPNFHDPITFISGSNIIWSTDVAELLIKEDKFYAKYRFEAPDDMYFGLILKDVPVCHGSMWQAFQCKVAWSQLKDRIPDYAYQFRARYSYNPRNQGEPFDDEIYILKELLKKYYSITLPE